MSTRSREGRIQRRRTPGVSRRTGIPLPWLLGGIVAAAAIVAAVALLLSGPGSGGTAVVQQPAAQPVQIAGSALPALPTSGPDPAVGLAFPKISGTDFSGNSSVIDPADGHPKLVMALAHWCPHCQAEMPKLVSWLRSNPLPANVELIGIATAIDPSRPNYPPSAWFVRENWPGQNLVDDANSTALAALGLNSFPGWVLVASDGTVIERLTGEEGTSVYPGLMAKLR